MPHIASNFPSWTAPATATHSAPTVHMQHRDDGWIATADRLPDDMREVLVLFDGGCKDLIYYLAFYDSDEGWRGDGNAIPGVKFWRELPALPTVSSPTVEVDCPVIYDGANW